MTWDREPLWAKSKLYFERAFGSRHDDEVFGIWCSLGLELLARAAVASVSPVLLADPDREQNQLLHALNRGSEKIPKKSLAMAQVLNLCTKLFDDFTEAHMKTSLALINRRNEELLSGTAAFIEYPSNKWIGGMYRVCKTLAESCDESLESLLGTDEAEAAQVLLNDIDNDIKQRVKSRIASYAKVFDDKTAEEKAEIFANIEQAGEELAWQRHHRVTCPACAGTATVQGVIVGKGNREITEDEIIVRETVSPRKFECTGCGLRREPYVELEAAGIGGHYTRTTTYTPEDFYNLVNMDDYDLTDDVIAYLEWNPEVALKIAHSMEYDNE